MVFIQLAHEEKTAEFIQGIYNILLILFLLESLYFNLVFTGRRLNILIKVILALLASVVFTLFIFKSGEFLHLTRNRDLWVYELINLNFWFILYSPLLATIVFLMLHTLYCYSKNALSNKEKKQAGVMMISILLACSTGFCFLMIMPLVDAFRVPLLTPYFFAVYLFGVFFAITRYRFMVFGIKDIAQDALSFINDMVIIAGRDRRILDMNRSASVKLASGSAALYGRVITDIVEEGHILDSIFQFILLKGGSEKCRIIYNTGPEPVVTDSTISAVRDRFGDITSLLVVSRENRGVSHFRNYFKLTAREMEIILHTISGMTNNEIAAVLDITKRTVETHQNNIYNKLGISNKIELLNITGDFGIKPL